MNQNLNGVERVDIYDANNFCTETIEELSLISATDYGYAKALSEILINEIEIETNSMKKEDYCIVIGDI